jgi:predicted dehydrogenase
MSKAQLGIGIIGTGFIARFHLQSFVAVRNADIRGVFSPNREHANDAAALARSLDLGATRAYGSIEEMAADPAIEAIWLCGPNHTRIENMEAIVVGAERRREPLKGLACEKPLARNVSEAVRMVELAKRAKIPTGYLEDQVFSPATETGRRIIWERGAAVAGRPYLARAAEEHSGPHMPWFWQGQLQGGGVLNDMMCHSVLVVRHLLTKPGALLATVRPVRVTAHIASLKWSRPEYAKRLKRSMGKQVDYARHPSEDFASATIEFETDTGTTAIGEVTTSWSYVGAGLRLSEELLGPEYSMSWNSLDTGLKVFLSRELQGKEGEDLVEKQNAESGLMPVLAGEAAAYGYEGENRHFVRAFLNGTRPELTFDDGLEVVRLLMTAYQSAERGRTLAYPPRGLDTYRPLVARGKWNPGKKRKL